MSEPTRSGISAQEILDQLDQAIAEHVVWLKDWHRTLLCDDAPSAEDLAYDPSYLCRFGSWYVRNQHRGLVDQPVIRNLADLHRNMHDRAEALSEVARDGETLPRDKYDAFMDTAGAFIAQARRLEKAFSAATSDLDPLTGLHNRQAMMKELEQERARALRTESPCCVAIGDLDHFKAINDTHGHAAGDRVLLATADCFLGQLRSYDAVYRYGGEEFLFCLPNADEATAERILERLRQALKSRRVDLDDGSEVSVTGSFGFAPLGRDVTVEEAIDRADQALYRAKTEGRNRVCRWNPARDSAADAGGGD